MPVASTRRRARIRLGDLPSSAARTGLPRRHAGHAQGAKTFRPSRFYNDRLTARPLVAGTVPQGGLADDEVLLSGTINGRLVTLFPFPVTREVLRRGQERFNIFCAPCHGALGDGEGHDRTARIPPPAFVSHLTGFVTRRSGTSTT